jgi:predicted XRE-type DNA-binding protein
MNDHDITITESSGNVFVDLGFPHAEAEVMKLRAEVMIRMKERLKEAGWTQAEAARHLGVTQPRVCRLIKGKVEDFSLDTLLVLSFKAGLSPELRIG